jgi:hypothetical protein
MNTMALLGNFDGYTKTGGNFFTRLSNMATYIPLPWVNTVFVNLFGWIGTAIDTAGWLFRGKFKSAITALGAGAASTLTNTAVGAAGAFSPIWWANLGSGILTDHSLGSQARKVAEVGIGGITGVLGGKPQVLQSNFGAVGSIGGGATQGTPGRWVSDVARSKGEDPNAAYARLNSNQADHIAALESAQQQGGYRSV